MGIDGAVSFLGRAYRDTRQNPTLFRRAAGKGKVPIAPVILKEIQIGELSVERVPAAVIEGGSQSVLGMSFLARLKSFEIRNGALTIDW